MKRTDLIHLQSALNKLVTAFSEVYNAIERDSDFDEYICDDYPFDKSFDDVARDVMEWGVTMRNKIQKDVHKRR